jgi:hypothetical protein
VGGWRTGARGSAGGNVRQWLQLNEHSEGESLTNKQAARPERAPGKSLEAGGARGETCVAPQEASSDVALFKNLATKTGS